MANPWRGSIGRESLQGRRSARRRHLTQKNVILLDIGNRFVVRLRMIPSSFSHCDPEFEILRESICANVRAMQYGLPFESSFQQGQWDEARFWDRFIEETRRGAFDGFLRCWNRESVPDLWRTYCPHFEAGRFDDLIRAWARNVSS